MNLNPHQRFHVGVYGLLIKDKKVLLIKKSRGAYTGMYDLPGGGIEFGEKLESALRREILEETGLNISEYYFIGNNEHFCNYNNEKNEPSSLHHLGMYYAIKTDSRDIKTDADGEDSLGAVFIDINELDKIEIAPIAKTVIEKVIRKTN